MNSKAHDENKIFSWKQANMSQWNYNLSVFLY